MNTYVFPISSHETFGDALKSVLMLRDLTQTALAKLLDVTPSVVSQWANDFMVPYASTRLKIVDAIGDVEIQLNTRDARWYVFDFHSTESKKNNNRTSLDINVNVTINFKNDEA